MNMRTIAGVACIYVALYGMPEIDLPDIPVPSVPSTPKIKEPSMEMQRAVSDVADICEKMEVFDRLVWMATWEDAADLISGEEDGVEIEFANTLGLQVWQQTVFDIAWKRLAGASGKYKGLGDAVEKAFASTIGNEIRPVDEDTLMDVVELYEALAWAGAKSE